MNLDSHFQVAPPQVLMNGFPGASPRGFLGWSTIMLVRHLEKIILLDTGGPGDRVGLLEALERNAVEPSAVDTIVLSHLHFDHASNVELFPNAEVLIHRTELDYARDAALEDLAICGWAADAIARHPRLKILEGEPELLAGIQVMHTPGHTPGCISLAMVVEGELWVLAQDAVKNREELTSGEVAMASDLRAARASLERIRSVAHVVVPGHDVPLRIEGDTVVPLAEARAEITEILTGRTYRMSVGSTRP